MRKKIDKMNSGDEHNRRGSVLVAVLIVISTMLILSVGLTYRTRMEMELAFAHAQRAKSYYLALGGLERIKVLLSSNELTPAIITQICQFNNSADIENLFRRNTGIFL